MKNMEIICATKFTPPIKTKTNAIRAVKNVALKGSFVMPFPFAISLFNPLIGKESSIARACNVRGATIMDPIADEIVDAASPKGIMMGPNMAILLIIN